MKNCIKVLRLHFHVSFKMSNSKCGLCLKDLEVIKPASGIPYIRCVDWKLCPFFCRENSIDSYQQCLCNRAVPEYKVQEGGQLPYCRHMDVAALLKSQGPRRIHSGPTLPVEEKKCVDSSSGLTSYLWMKDHLQFTALKKTNTFQDQGCKDNLPFQKTGILEHSTCLLYY